MDWKDINEAFKLYEMLMLDFHGEDEITINYEETEALFEERKVWGIKLHDKDNVLVKSTDTDVRDTRVCHTTPIFRFTDRLHAAGTALFFEDFDWSNMDNGVYESLVTFAKKSMPAKVKAGASMLEGILDHQNNMPFIFDMVNSNILKAALMCKIRRGDIIKKLEYQEGDTRKIFLEGAMSIKDLIRQRQYYPIKIILQHTVKPLTLALNHEQQFNIRGIRLDGSDLLQNVQWDTRLAHGLGLYHRLEILDLGRNNVGRDGCIMLAALLLNTDGLSLKVLSLVQSQIDDECITILCNGLQNNKTLTTLDLQGNNSITLDGWECLSDLVCNRTDINSTYQSNHTLESVGKLDELINSSATGTLIDLTGGETGILVDLELHGALKCLRKVLVLNKRRNEHSVHVVARQKIWCAHFKNRDFDLNPFLNVDVELMPHVLAWFANENQTTEDIDNFGNHIDYHFHWKALYYVIRNHWDIPVLFGFPSADRLRITELERMNEKLKTENIELKEENEVLKVHLEVEDMASLKRRRT